MSSDHDPASPTGAGGFRGPVLWLAIAAGVLLVAVVVVAVLLLGGGDPAPEPAPTPTTSSAAPTATPQPVETVEPTVPPIAFVMPGCDALAPADAAPGVADGSLTSWVRDERWQISDGMPGPVAQAAATAAPAAVMCAWLPTGAIRDGFDVTRYVQMDAAAWDALAAALEGGGWTSIEVAGEPGYTSTWTTDDGAEVTWVYAFTGDLWVAIGPAAVDAGRIDSLVATAASLSAG